MKERPILFTTEMVLAILEERKTMTQRVIKPQPIEIGYWKETGELVFSTQKYAQVEATTLAKECRFGVPGDRLWVKETFNWSLDDELIPNENYKLCPERIGYRARNVVWKAGASLTHPEYGAALWKPSIFMPRWASRITLEVTHVRVRRLHRMTYADCIAEGIVDVPRSEKRVSLPGERPTEKYQALWNSLNAKRGYGWDVDPLVWVVEFRRIS